MVTESPLQVFSLNHNVNAYTLKKLPPWWELFYFITSYY